MLKVAIECAGVLLLGVFLFSAARSEKGKL